MKQANKTLFLKSQTLFSIILLTAGVSLPCIKIEPKMGKWTEIVKMLKPDILKPTILSISTGIIQLFAEHEYFIGALILVFSILFPFAKLIVIWNALINIDSKNLNAPGMYIAEKFGKYSMLDVLVMALLVICFKGLPGNSAVSMQPGAYLFCCSVLISMFLPNQIKKFIIVRE
jgi:hypothetical protein